MFWSFCGDHAGLSELARIINSTVRPHGAQHHSQFIAPWQLAVCLRHFAVGTAAQLLSLPMEFTDDEPKIAYSGNRVLLVPRSLPSALCRRHGRSQAGHQRSCVVYTQLVGCIVGG